MWGCELERKSLNFCVYRVCIKVRISELERQGECLHLCECALWSDCVLVRKCLKCKFEQKCISMSLCVRKCGFVCLKSGISV